MYGFVNPKNSAQYDDLTAFKSFYKESLLPRCLEVQNSGGNFRIGFKAELGEIRKAADKVGAMKIIVAVTAITDSLKKDVQLLSLADKISEIEEAFDDVLHGDLGALNQLYPLINSAYEGNSDEIAELLEIMAVEHNALPLIYLIEAKGNLANITIEDIKSFEEEFKDPKMFKAVYENLKGVYEENKIDVSLMKVALLKEILANMDPLDEDEEDLEEELLDQEIQNANILIEELGLDNRLPESFLNRSEVNNPVLAQKYELMSHILKLVVFSANSQAFYALMDFESFEDIFNSQKDFFMEAMYTSSDSLMVLGTLEFMDERPSDIHAQYLINTLKDLELQEVEEIINSAIEDRNFSAMNFIVEALSGKDANKDVVSLMLHALESSIFADAPEIVEVILDSGILKKSDIKALDLHLMFGEAEETKDLVYDNLQLKLPSMILASLEDGNIELFDNLMTIIGYENINLQLDEKATTPLMFAIEAGNSDLARHMLDNYYNQKMLRFEALICTKEDEANILHLIHPSLDPHLVDRILAFEGVDAALAERIEDKMGIECAGLTPLQAIIRKFGIDGASLINKYVDSGAGIWDEDSNGMNIFGWVELNATSAGEDGPIYGLYQKMLKDVEAQKAIIAKSRKSSISEYDNDSAVSDLDISSSSESGGSTPQSPTCIKAFAYDTAWHTELCRVDATVGLSGEGGGTSAEVESY